MIWNSKSIYVIRLGVLIFLGLLLVRPAITVRAQDTTPSDDAVNRIASQLYCPVCENIPLDVCPTEACEQWRELIRQKLAEGWTEAEIKAFFVAQYGDRVLAAPPRRGLNWLIYVLPPLVILAGGYLLLRNFQAKRRSVSQNAGDFPDDPYLAQVERDLADMD